MRLFKFRLKSKQILSITEPSVKECDGILNPANVTELIDAAEKFLSRNLENVNVRDQMTDIDIIALRIMLQTWLEEIKKDPAYKSPPVQSTAQPVIPYNCITMHIKAVADYARMSFPEVWSLPITEFWKLFRDAVIWNYSRTAEGIEQLEHAKAMSATEPDREKLSSNPAIVRRQKNGK